jgi:hypothetical protein
MHLPAAETLGKALADNSPRKSAATDISASAAPRELVTCTTRHRTGAVASSGNLRAAQRLHSARCDAPTNNPIRHSPAFRAIGI